MLQVRVPRSRAQYSIARRAGQRHPMRRVDNIFSIRKPRFFVGARNPDSLLSAPCQHFAVVRGCIDRLPFHLWRDYPTPAMSLHS
jgi:hypothetical protein